MGALYWIGVVVFGVLYFAWKETGTGLFLVAAVVVDGGAFVLGLKKQGL